MSIVHPFDLDGPAAFACAQSKCPECQGALVRQHEGLVHVVLRRQSRGDVPYEDLLQAGLIGLWQAVLHFDPDRGVAFSTYAGVAIQRHIWQAVRRASRPAGWLLLPEPRDPIEIAEEQVWWEQVEVPLVEAVSRLPDRLCQVMRAAYGRASPPQSGCYRATVWRHPRDGTLLAQPGPVVLTSARLLGTTASVV